MNKPAIRVVKVGGSLLSDFHLGTQLAGWLDAQVACPTLLVVGGGELANAVRTLDRRYGVSSQCAHWLAIRAMQVNSYLLCQLCPSLAWIERIRQWQSGHCQTPRKNGIVDPEAFLLCDEPLRRGTRLPCGWQVTSDSIAARLAESVGAPELVLLKSTLPESVDRQLSLPQVAERGFVDAHFPVAAKSIEHVRAVNLRCPGWPELLLSASPP